MENASKALIMSGGILIGVIILSIAVYLFTAFGGSSKQIQEQVDSRVIAEFNNNFLKYQGSEECTIHDVVNLAKFAKKTNEQMGYDISDYQEPFYIQVILIGNGRKELTQFTEQQLVNLLNDESVGKDASGNMIGKLQYYKCEEVKFDNPEQANRVSKVIFRKIN